MQFDQPIVYVLICTTPVIYTQWFRWTFWTAVKNELGRQFLSAKQNGFYCTFNEKKCSVLWSHYPPQHNDRGTQPNIIIRKKNIEKLYLEQFECPVLYNIVFIGHLEPSACLSASKCCLTTGFLNCYPSSCFCNCFFLLQ